MKKIAGLIFILSILVMQAGYGQVIKGTYAIKNVQTGMLLRIKDANKKDGTPLVAYEPTNWKCMTWDFMHVEGQTYQLKNLFTGKTFQQAADHATGSDMQQQPLVPNVVVQEYDFIPVDKNIYLIKSKASGLYLTPKDGNGTVNSGIVLSEKTGSKLQQWTIYEQHPTM